MVDRDSIQYRLFDFVFLKLFRWFPESNWKNSIRAVLFSQFCTPFLFDWLKIPRQELLIANGDTVVMIGTSSGKRVHLLADLVGENGSVYIFEPSPENFEAVRRAAESHENVSVDNRGAWYESAEKTMRLSAKTRGGHRVSDAETAPMPHDQYHDEHTIQVEPIDFLLDEYGVSPDYLEIAAAGTELEILRGARETLAGELRLFVKAWGVVLDSHEDHATEIESLLRDSGFQISTARVRSGIDSAGVPDGDIFAWK